MSSLPGILHNDFHNNCLTICLFFVDRSTLDLSSLSTALPRAGFTTNQEMERILASMPPPPPPTDPYNTQNKSFNNNIPQDHLTTTQPSPHNQDDQEMFASFDDPSTTTQSVDSNSFMSGTPSDEYDDNILDKTDPEVPADELLFDKQTSSTNPQQTNSINGSHDIPTQRVSSSTSPSSKQPQHDFGPSNATVPVSNKSSGPSPRGSNDFGKISTSDTPSNSSSLDAFEASFASTFPTTFSSSSSNDHHESTTAPLSIAFDVPEFSDPFFLGALDMDNENMNGNNAFGELSSAAFESSNDMMVVHGKNPDSFSSPNNDFNVSSDKADISGSSSSRSTNDNKIDFMNSPSSSTMTGGFENRNNTLPSKSNDDGFGTSSMDFFPNTSNVFDFVDEPTDKSSFIVVGKGASSTKQTNSNSPNSSSSDWFQTPDNQSQNTSAPSRPQKNISSHTARARYVAATSTPNTLVDEKIKQQVSDSDQQQSRMVNLNNSGEMKKEEIFSSDNNSAQNNGNPASRRLQRRSRDDGSVTSSSNKSANPQISDVQKLKKEDTVNTSASKVDRSKQPSPLTNNMNKNRAPLSISANQVSSIPPPNSSSSSANNLITPTNNSNASIVTPRSGKSSSERRRVRQPISYAEPSIRDKLRRGDVFFPKKEMSPNNKPAERNTSDSPSKMSNENSSSNPGSLVVTTIGGDSFDTTTTTEILQDLASASSSAAQNVPLS